MVSSATRKAVILSADDDDNAHILLGRAYLKSGSNATLITVNDGSDAIRYLSGEGEYSDRQKYPWPDVLLLDLKMPKVSGFGVLEHIRKHPALQTIPVVVFSSSDNECDVKKASELGCYAYVVKPTNFEDLVRFAKALETQFSTGTRPVDAGDAPLSYFTIRKPEESSAQASARARVTVPLRVLTANSPEIFKLIVEQVKDYAIFMLDREGFILSWNEGARRIKGYEAHEIIGKHFSTFYPAQDKENEKPQFELKMAIEMGRYEEEGWRIRKDGSRFWANVIITPLRDSEGRLSGFAKVTRDLTQRKMQEENFQRLLDTEERFRLLVEQVRDYGIFILDAKGHIASWNQGARRLNGYSSDEIIGQHFSIFYTHEAIASDHPAKELQIAIRDGRYEEEGWRVRKDGSYFWAHVVITALWDKRGNLRGFAKVTKDLSEKRQQELALQQKTAELEAFAHTLSHDLRAPLRSIASFSQILQMEKETITEEQSKIYLEKISKSASSMSLLINDVLRLSQLSLASAPQETVFLDGVMDEALAMLESEIAATHPQIHIRKPLPSVQGNRTLLVQVFLNLFGNALKFVSKGKSAKIEVFATAHQGSCKIHVKDSGIGIKEIYQQTIFRAFERGSAMESFSGTGVGLAIVKRAVERMGGTVEVESQEGEGSDFIVTLHCASQAPVLTK